MPLRQIQVRLPESETSQLDELLEEHQVCSFWQGENGAQDTVMTLLVVDAFETDQLVQDLIDRFENNEEFRLAISEVSAFHPKEDKEEEKDQSDDSGDLPAEKELTPRAAIRLTIEELEERLSSEAQVSQTYIITVLISALVAGLGLLHEDTAVIIGAMVIAPLLGPNMSLALGTTLGNFKLILRSLYTNVIGLGCAFLFAVGFGFLITTDPENSEILSRTVVDYSAILLALASGAAGAIAVTTGVSAALVGVMVAVALMPPLVTSGLLLGEGEWQLAAKAGLLTAINLISVNLAAVTVFICKGIKPRNYWDEDKASTTTRAAFALWGILLAVLAGLIWFTNK